MSKLSSLCQPFQDFITQKEAESPNITIAAKIGGQEEVADRYYNFQEWSAMSPEKRKAIVTLREKRGNVHKKS